MCFAAYKKCNANLDHEWIINKVVREALDRRNNEAILYLVSKDKTILDAFLSEASERGLVLDFVEQVLSSQQQSVDIARPLLTATYVNNVGMARLLLYHPKTTLDHSKYFEVSYVRTPLWYPVVRES